MSVTLKAEWKLGWRVLSQNKLSRIRIEVSWIDRPRIGCGLVSNWLVDSGWNGNGFGNGFGWIQMGFGTLQSGFAVGNMLGSGAWYAGPASWAKELRDLKSLKRSMLSPWNDKISWDRTLCEWQNGKYEETYFEAVWDFPVREAKLIHYLIVNPPKFISSFLSVIHFCTLGTGAGLPRWFW